MKPVDHQVFKLAIIIPFLPPSTRFLLWKHLWARGRHIWSPVGMAQRVEGAMYIKLSSLVRSTEGAVINYVRNNTNIPVPIVIDNITVDSVTALVIGEMPGGTVRDLRQEIGMTDEQARKLSLQLSGMLSQLRALPHPSQSVCGFGGTPVRCERVGMDSPPRGPWASVSEFHAYLIQRAQISVPPDMSDAVWEKIKSVHARTHRVCLTHNDLAPHNILVDNDYNITGIIDWEASAWLPEYWEYTKALYLPWYRKGWWFRVMSDVFPQYEDERQAEYYIWKYREVYS